MFITYKKRGLKKGFKHNSITFYCYLHKSYRIPGEQSSRKATYYLGSIIQDKKEFHPYTRHKFFKRIRQKIATFPITSKEKKETKKKLFRIIPALSEMDKKVVKSFQRRWRRINKIVAAAHQFGDYILQ